MSKAKVTKARGEFKDLLETNIDAPIQKVELVKKSVQREEKDEAQLMVWVPIDLMVKIKTKVVIEKRSMKEIVIEILEKNL
jgi:hypothetical protein